MPNTVRNVLFLCHANSARSILAEALMDHWGKGRFKAYSAGSAPTGQIQPMALQLIQQLDMPTEALRSKSWDEFMREGAPRMDFVFTVCEIVANAPQPAWPGNPITALWSVPDPVAATGNDAERMVAYREALSMLERRIQIFASLPHEALNRLRMQHRVVEIGQDAPAEAHSAA